jgi:hypothetical protein
MVKKAPRPAAPSEPNRAGNIEGFGDAFNSPDSKRTGQDQGTQASEARVEAGAATTMPPTGQARPAPQDGLAWRHLTPPGQTGLDAALARLFPTMPEKGRRSLRQPLEHWRRAAFRYLRSRRTHSDADDFMACWFGLPGRYTPKRRPCIEALLRGLHGEIGRAIDRRPCTCPWRQSCALLEVIDWLFLGVKGGEIITACPSAEGENSATCDPPGNTTGRTLRTANK